MQKPVNILDTTWRNQPTINVELVRNVPFTPDPLPIVIVNGNNITDGWSNGGAKDFVSSTGTVTSVSRPFVTNIENQLSAENGYTWYSVIANNTLTISKEQSIYIGVKAINNYGGELIVRYSTDNINWTNAKDFTTELRNSEAMENFNIMTIDNIQEGNYYVQIIGKAININSVILKI